MKPTNALDALRCLEQLRGPSSLAGTTALEVSRREDLAPARTQELLELLCRAGLARAADDRFWLAAEPAEIHVAAVWRAVGAEPRGLQPGLTLAHLLEWEAGAFADERVATAA